MGVSDVGNGETSMTFDVFVHTWKNSTIRNQKNLYTDTKHITNNTDYVFDFIIKEYQPKKILIEDSRDFDPNVFYNIETLKAAVKMYFNHIVMSNYMSQFFSLVGVCNLITPDIEDEYDYFVLTRFDHFLNEFDQTEFSRILSKTDCFRSFPSLAAELDVIQISGKDVIKIYKNELIQHIKETKFSNGFNPEFLRFSLLMDKGYTFYGNLYIERHLERLPASFFKDLKYEKSIVSKSFLIRDKKNLIENLLDYNLYYMKSAWFLSSCGFLFFHIDGSHFLVKKLKKHSSYTEEFDPKKHLKNNTIKYIKLFGEWYSYNHTKAIEIINQQSEFCFEIKIDL